MPVFHCCTACWLTPRAAVAVITCGQSSIRLIFSVVYLKAWDYKASWYDSFQLLEQVLLLTVAVLVVLLPVVCITVGGAVGMLPWIVGVVGEGQDTSSHQTTARWLVFLFFLVCNHRNLPTSPSVRLPHPFLLPCSTPYGQPRGTERDNQSRRE